MVKQLDEIEIVRRAQLGDKQSLSFLANIAKERLRVYVYRLTLNDDLTQEIVQESLLEMCKALGKLRNRDKFWSWLYGIATNKLHRHHRSERTRIKASLNRAVNNSDNPQKHDGLEDLVNQELKQIISSAMSRLKTRYKAVLVMRCYDEMSYADIAESLGCSEFGTRMLFVRAKRALQKELSRNGLGRGALLASLILFGKITAPSKVAAAQISVTSASLKVGLGATIAGLATTKTALVTLTTAGVITAGAVVSNYEHQNKLISTMHDQINTISFMDTSADSTAGQYYWYYYPQGPQGPLMMRAGSGSGDKQTQWQLLQNDQANYYYKDDTIYINNYRTWSSDLRVMRLPTDDASLIRFLSKVEGDNHGMQYINGSGRGLLVIAERSDQGQLDTPWKMHHSNILDEEYFLGDWPSHATTVDNRDAMHRRGWTYFKITGRLDGKDVNGYGRIPFIYTEDMPRPWLKLDIGRSISIIDIPEQAEVIIDRNINLSRFASGSFFRGLPRPWQGLHTIDTIRRDAAEQQLSFQTKLKSDKTTAEVRIISDSVELIYSINMPKDVVERIDFNVAGVSKGFLEFSWLQEIPDQGDQFQPPTMPADNSPYQNNRGIFWLIQLAEGTLGQQY
jgi:RNA polymerase sigma-70 factor (ECF subfamily)